jgi:hypothetical protein
MQPNALLIWQNFIIYKKWGYIMETASGPPEHEK